MWNAENRTFEYREYTPCPGRLPFLAERFEKHAIPAYRRAGCDPMGFFFVDSGDEGHFVDILGWKTTGNWEEDRVKFSTDPVWREASQRYVREYGPPYGNLYYSIKNRFLKPYPFSPMQ